MDREPDRFVLGICYQAGPDPRIKRGMDGGRDMFSKAELERACWSYMRSGCPQLNAFHVDGTEDCAEPVESFIWRWPDWDVGDGIVVKDGDWCLGAILSPRMWALHKAGKINGLSPEGTAIRRRVQKEGAVTLTKGSVDVVVDDDEEDEFSELVGANVPKVALVGQPANGIPRFLISKQEGAVGLADADFVHELLAKADPEPPAADLRETVTMTGSPAAIAEFIHSAAIRKAMPEPTAAEPGEVVKSDAEQAYERIVKAKYNAADLKRMAASGAAMENESYPIADKEDVEHAVRAVGRGGASHNAIRAHVIRRAKAIGASSMIPDNWGADGSLKKADGDAAPEPNEVSKDMDGSAGMPLDDGMDGMDPTVVLACPEEDAPGDPNDPGSPAWESIDAATALKWTAISARLRTALGVMSDREALEAATADPTDAENAMDLGDAAAAIDFVIQTLAPFAANEQAEADDGAMDMGILGKAMAAVDTAHLETVESLGAIRKSGRALSSSNESKLRAALTALQQILASLPKAPDAPTPATDGAAMMKEADSMAETDTARDEINSQVPLGTPKEPAIAETPAAMGEPGVVAKTADTAGVEPETAPTEVAKAHEPVVDEFDVFAKRLAEVLAVPIPARFRRQEQEAEPLAKAAETPAEPTATADPTATEVAKSETTDLAKAEKTPQVAIYDAKGNLVGTVDPTEITMLAPAKAPEAPTETEAAPEAPAAPAAETPAAPPTDLTPAPAASVGTPADAVPAPSDDTVAKATDTPEDPQDMLKSSITDLVKAAIDEHSAAQAEIVKTLENQNATLEERNAALAKQAASLEERLSNIEQQDAHPRVFANGMLPPKTMMRGQDAGAPTGLSEAQSLRKQLAEATDIATQERISERMRQLAVQEYQDMRQRGAAI